MEESKFFKNIWRFNALVIAAVGCFSIIITLFTGYMIYKDKTRTEYRHEIVNIDPETKVEESFRLGNIDRVQGSKAVIIPLYSEQSFDLKYSSKSTASTRNLMFSNMHTETNKWLMPTHKYLIPYYHLIKESNSYDNKKDVIVILYSVVKSDTNNDNRLTSSDVLTIALSNPEGDNYKEVLSNVDNVLDYDLINPQTIAIMFNRNGQGYIAYINLTKFTVKKEMALPKI